MAHFVPAPPGKDKHAECASSGNKRRATQTMPIRNLTPEFGRGDVDTDLFTAALAHAQLPWDQIMIQADEWVCEQHILQEWRNRKPCWGLVDPYPQDNPRIFIWLCSDYVANHPLYSGHSGPKQCSQLTRENRSDEPRRHCRSSIFFSPIKKLSSVKSQWMMKLIPPVVTCSEAKMILHSFPYASFWSGTRRCFEQSFLVLIPFA